MEELTQEGCNMETDIMKDEDGIEAEVRVYFDALPDEDDEKLKLK
jgi:hypothetical protein